MNMENKEEKPFYKNTTFIVWSVAAFLALVVIIAKMPSNDLTSKPVKPYTEMSLDEQKAYLNDFVTSRKSRIADIVEEAVSKQLKAPSQADFMDDINFSVDQYITRQIIATGTVDAPNSFGAKMRVSYRCLFAIANDNGDIEIIKTAIDE